MNTRSRPLSLAGLRGFAAAAAHLSFTRAGSELHLTQSALSRQIQSLEDELGQPLFVRGVRRLELTPAGEALRRAAVPALRAIDECVAQLRRGQQRRRVVVSTFASFASLWLIPRLQRFTAAHPDVDVHCIASDRLVDLDAEEVDVALRCSTAAQAGAVAHFLFDDVTTPMCSPALTATADAPLRAPADLARHTLLMPAENIELAFPWLGWQSWLDAQGLGDLPIRSTLRFSNHDQVIQAALAGQGVALARTPLVADLVAAGRLVAPLGPGTRSPNSYFVSVAARADQRSEVQAFVTWVREEARLTRELLAAA